MPTLTFLTHQKLIHFLPPNVSIFTAKKKRKKKPRKTCPRRSITPNVHILVATKICSHCCSKEQKIAEKLTEKQMNFVWFRGRKNLFTNCFKLIFQGGPTGWYFVEKQSTPIGQGFKTLKTDCLFHMKPPTSTNK